ncbi:MAG: cyclic nucleotide-binding domain-containing protein [Deltaproteobacteria bacterium]|nr:MAG: cyclic nucleotide-binding domain-containing protein [Deltaproteobacteria bacterium]
MNSNSENNKKIASCEFQDNLNILRQIDFFSTLPLELNKILAYLCTRDTYKEEEYLFHENDDDGQAYYIISGKARLFYNQAGKQRMIRDYEAGAFFGRLALLGNMPRIFSMKAINELTCLTLTREKFTKALSQFPDQMPKIIKAVAESIQGWEKRFLLHGSENCEACMHNIGVSLV